MLFALASAPAALARSLLDDVVSGDARLAWRGTSVGLAAPPGADVLLEHAHFVVVDLETTGLSPRTSRICEIGAQRVRALALEDAFETLVDPGVPLPPAVASLTGIQPGALRGAPRADHAVRQLLAFAGDAALVAHNARFDLAFLDREVTHLTGRRIAAPVVDTVWLARRLLAERTRRVGLGDARALLRRLDRAVPPRPAGRPRDGGDPRHPDRARPGAGRPLAVRPRRARRPARAAPALEALARRGRADEPRRLRVPGRRRDAALRRPRAAAARAPPLVLRRRAAAARRGGGARRARAGRVARDGLRARGGARGAAAPPRPAASGERARHAPRPPRLPPAPRSALERHERADEPRAAHREGRRASCGAGARRPRVGRRRGGRRAAPRPARRASRATSASRTRRVSATASRRSRRRSPRSGSCSASGACVHASSCRPGAPASYAPMRSRVDGSRRSASSRRARPRPSRSRRSSRRRRAWRGRRPRRTPTSSGWSRRSSAARRPSSASPPLDPEAIAALVDGLPLAA